MKKSIKWILAALVAIALIVAADSVKTKQEKAFLDVATLEAAQAMDCHVHSIKLVSFRSFRDESGTTVCIATYRSRDIDSRRFGIVRGIVTNKLSVSINVETNADL